MSDFIYSKKPIKPDILTREIQAIYHREVPVVHEFHGEWGSLAVSENLYNGFQLYETREHICITLGGPVLCFRDNHFLNNGHSMTGTKAIYHRWIGGTIKWDDDLSGPFAILILNKKHSEVHCVTDLMSFIPVYSYQDSTNIVLATHVDSLARVTGQQDQFDVVSKVDFILHGVVTFPYTAYTLIRQVAPASHHVISGEGVELKSRSYWVPEETFTYRSINQAARELRSGLQKYVDDVASGMPRIAQFISGGEDSRALSALLPRDCQRDAFVFLDSMNREGKVARKAASAYEANFHLVTRSKLHYLDILPSCADLVGDGSQYFHAHTFGFHRTCKLNEYSAVFGGLFSDALLKGARIRKFRGSGLIPFFPQIKRANYSVAHPLSNQVFTNEVLLELTKRRQTHLNDVKSIRTESAEEWFELWPSSMNMNIPNLHANRRLFRSYEPFMAMEVVKLSASVPQKWKLNRRLFHRAVQPLLQPTKWLLHSDGRLPYFPWYTNSFVQFGMWVYEQVGTRTGLIKGNQGPWGQWDAVMNSSEWEQAVDKYSSGMKTISPALHERDVKRLFQDSALNYVQKINLIQTLYSG